jgi:hypothetical protein
MKSTEEIIKERFDEMSGNECRDFLIKSVDYCKQNLPEEWKEDEGFVLIVNAISTCMKYKKLSLQQFKLINRYTNVVEIFNNSYKTWD